MTLKQDNPLSSKVQNKLDAVVKQLASSSYLMGFAHCQGVSVNGEDWTKPYPEKVYVDPAMAELTKLLLEQRIDPFDFVQPCKPDCSKERHAYHQGQWDMAERIEAQLNQLDKEKHEKDSQVPK